MPKNKQTSGGGTDQKKSGTETSLIVSGPVLEVVDKRKLTGILFIWI